MVDYICLNRNGWSRIFLPTEVGIWIESGQLRVLVLLVYQDTLGVDLRDLDRE